MLYCVIQSMNGGSKDLTGGTAMIYTALTKKAMKVAYEAHHGQTESKRDTLYLSSISCSGANG